MNSDGRVDVLDLATVGMAFNMDKSSPYWNTSADLNNDGVVSVKDLALVEARFGRTY